MSTTWWSEPTEDAPPLAEARYRLGEELGRGGMGRVLAAEDTLLHREVAIKLVLPGASERMVQRFLAEARLTAALQHPSIVPVHDAGQLADGTLFYVMKRIRGETLESVLARTRGPARLRLVDRLVAVAQAVGHAHAAGILHRDLKPGNIMIGERGETLVVDWGLAQLASASGGVAGTPGYASPEQARGEALDVRADVWSLGAILFEILSGAGPVEGKGASTVPNVRTGPPFTGTDPIEILVRTGREPPPPTRSVAPAAPGPLLAIADRALAFAPADRYPDVDAFLHDLEAWRDGRRVSAYEYPADEALRLLLRRWRRPLVTAGVATSAALVAATVGFVQVRQEQAETARTLADSLVEQALAADREGDAVAATAYALGALDITPSTLARGLLIRHWDTFPLRLRAWSGATCRAVGPTSCADEEGLTIGAVRVPLPGILALSEGAGRVLVATAREVVRLDTSGTIEARWPVAGVRQLAQDPLRPDRSAWEASRVIYRSDLPDVTYASGSFVSAVAWSGEAVLAASGSGEVAGYWPDGSRRAVCVFQDGMSRAAFGPATHDGGLRLVWNGYDGQIRTTSVRADPLATGLPPCPVERTFGRSQQFQAFAWSDDAAWVAGVAGDGAVSVYGVDAVEALRLPPSGATLPRVAGLADGIRVAGAFGTRDFGAATHRFAGASQSDVKAVDLHPNGDVLLTRTDSSVERRRPDGTLLWTVPGPSDSRQAVFVGPDVWVWAGSGMVRLDADGHVTGTGEALPMGVQADRLHAQGVSIAHDRLQALDGSWRVPIPAGVRAVSSAPDGWIVRDVGDDYLRVRTDGSSEPIGVPEGTTFVSASATGRLLWTTGRSLQIEGHEVGALEMDPYWTEWAGNRVLSTGLAEAHVHADDGSCLAVRRSPTGRFWDAASAGDRLAVLTWDRRVEIWDLGALALDPRLAEQALTAWTGVRLEGSALILVPDPADRSAP